jgi:predicted metal-binding membrane protein
MRMELGIVAALLAAAGLAWWSTADRMAGMDAAPGAALGSLGWFTGIWATMMVAMMLPSLASAAAAFAALVRASSAECSRSLRTGGSCLACTWALMAALFALGVMSLTWMALIAVLVALEKLGPWRRGASLATPAY